MSQGEHSRRSDQPVPVPVENDLSQPPPVTPAPTVEAWAAMSPAEQERVEVTLVEALTAEEQEARLAMPEGSDHYHTKEEIRGTLDRFFSDRGVFIGVETGVFYPGQRGFAPDVIIVTDVALHPRYSWVVSREGRGIDVIIEVHSRGDWRKDYVTNVKRYAELGVPEYFIFDVGRKTLTAYRLVRGERRYEPIQRRHGGYRSEVLGLDLRIRKGSLRFVHQGTVLATPAEWISELQEIAEQEQARAEQEQARAEQEQARADREQARADQEQARAETLIRQIREQLRGTLRRIIELRGLVPLSEEERVATEAEIDACGDPLRLQLWINRAWQAPDRATVFRDG